MNPFSSHTDKKPSALMHHPADEYTELSIDSQDARTENAVGVDTLPGKSMCLGLQSTLVLLPPAVCLPQMHHLQLHMLPAKALSTSHLKALHDCMNVDVMPRQQQSLLDLL